MKNCIKIFSPTKARNLRGFLYYMAFMACFSFIYSCSSPPFLRLREKFVGKLTTETIPPRQTTNAIEKPSYWFRCINMLNCRSTCRRGINLMLPECLPSEQPEVVPSPYGNNQASCGTRRISYHGSGSNGTIEYLVTACYNATIEYTINGNDISNFTELNIYEGESILYSKSNGSFTKLTLRSKGSTGIISFSSKISSAPQFTLTYAVINPEPAILMTTESPLSQRCGHTRLNNSGEDPGSSILNGQLAINDDYPWHATLYCGIDFFGGVVIHENWILTSGVCCKTAKNTDTQNVIVSLGGVDSTKAFPYRETSIELINHPEFQKYSDYSYNFCMIKVPAINFRFSWQIQPICLPNDCELCDKPLAVGFGQHLENASFTQPFLLRGSLVSIISSDKCRNFNTPNICTAASIGRGDEGSSLSCFSNGRHKLIGIASFYRGEGGNVYTQSSGFSGFGTVCAVKEWINSVIQQPSVLTSFAPIIDDGQTTPEVIKMGECGVTQFSTSFNPEQGVISAGSSAMLGELPWLALLTQDSSNIFCDGSLIHQSWILTSSSCCRALGFPANITVKMGGDNRSGKFLYIEKSISFTIHPANVFCLVQIPLAPTKFSWLIQTVCLDLQCANGMIESCPIGSKNVVTTWRDMIEMTYYTSVSCGNESTPDLMCLSKSYSSQMNGCNSSFNLQSICMKTNTRYLLNGLTMPECDMNASSKFVKVSKICSVMDWINDTLRGDNQAPTTTPVRPVAGVCGQTFYNNSAVGSSVLGRNALLDEFPWHALITYVHAVLGERYACSGALIESQWVLTSATCCNKWDFFPLKVYMGGKQMIGTFPFVSDVRYRFVHAEFDRLTLLNDFCLLIIDSVNLQYSWQLKTACLPEKCDSTYDCEPFSYAIASGYGGITGPTSQLQAASLQVLPLSTCRQTFPNADPNLQFCAGWTGAKSACASDIGSLLVCWRNNRFMLNGIFSNNDASAGCGTRGVPALFSKVCSAKKWIDAIINGTMLSVAQTSTTTESPVSYPRCGFNKYNNSNPSAPSIIGGRNALPAEFPWVARLLFSVAGTYMFTHGSLIDENWIITEALTCNQVAKPDDLFVYLGGKNQSALDFIYYKPVEAIFIHPNYRNRSDLNSICLLKIPTVARNWKIQPICLPEQCDDDFECKFGDSILVPGWGSQATQGVASSLLKVAELTLNARSGCNDTIRCADVNSGGSSICTSDVGSSAFCYKNSNGAILLGPVVSWNGSNCESSQFIYITRVCRFMPWIRSVMSSAPTTPALTTLLPPIQFKGCGHTIYNNSGEDPGRENLIGGTSALDKQFPWVAFLVITEPSLNLAFCSGAVISDQWVLTSAQCCYRGWPINVRLGSNFASTFPYSYDALEKFVHPRSAANVNGQYDFCMLNILKVSFSFSWGIQPVCLPQTCDRNYECQSYQLLSTAGWGAKAGDRELLFSSIQTAQFEVIPPPVCKQIFNSLNESLQMCVDWNAGINLCGDADTGAPLTCYINGRHILNGVASFARGQCAFYEGFPMAIARVCVVKPWIDCFLNRNNQTVFTGCT